MTDNTLFTRVKVTTLFAEGVALYVILALHQQQRQKERCVPNVLYRKTH